MIKSHPYRFAAGLYTGALALLLTFSWYAGQALAQTTIIQRAGPGIKIYNQPDGRYVSIADLTDVTEEATPASGDFLLGWVGNSIRRMDIGNLPSEGVTTSQIDSLAELNAILADGSVLIDEAGSVNLTTTGTITTGVWNGTAIADAYISSAAAWNAKQAGDATLTSLSSLGTVADRLAYTTGVDVWAEAPLTSFARTILDDVDAATVRATIGAGSGSGDVTKVGTPINNQVGVWTGDGTLEGAAQLDVYPDGTIDIVASGNVAFGGVLVLDDNGGTMTLSNVDALDATTETTIEAAIDTLPNLTTATGLNIDEAQISDLGTAIALVADNLGVFGATTSAQLAGVLSDEVGTGKFMLNTGPSVAVGLADVNGNLMLGFTPDASPANFLIVTNADAGVEPGLSAGGSDTDVNLTLTPKGAGTVDVVGAITVSGTVDGRDIAADGTKLDGVEALADVTDTANVTAAGALMDSEVDADLKTLALPASTTITAFTQTVLDDANAATARTTLGAAGTSDDLSVFAATTSAQLAGVLSDETGTGKVVMSVGPNLSAPQVAIGVADSANNLILGHLPDATPVNYMVIANADAGVAPALTTEGSDANVSLDIDPKGTGAVNITGNVAVTGTVDGRDVSVDGAKLDITAETYDTVAAMVALAQADLDVVHTERYHSGVQGGAGRYQYHATGRTGITVDSGLYHSGPGGDDYYALLVDGPLSVKQFGAKGDETTDDTAAIQAALNALRTLGNADSGGYRGSTLHIPGGYYRITATLNPGNLRGFTIVGDGRYGGQALAHPNATFPVAGSVLMWDGATGGTVMSLGCSDFELKDFSVWGALPAETTDYAGIGIHIPTQTGIASGNGMFHHVSVVRCTNGIQFGTNPTDANCEVMSGDGISFNYCDVGFSIKNNQSVGHAFGNITAYNTDTLFSVEAGGKITVQHVNMVQSVRVFDFPDNGGGYSNPFFVETVVIDGAQPATTQLVHAPPASDGAGDSLRVEFGTVGISNGNDAHRPDGRPLVQFGGGRTVVIDRLDKWDVEDVESTVVTYSAGTWTNFSPDFDFRNENICKVSSTGTLPTGFAAGTFYYMVNVDAGAETFQLSATRGGAPITGAIGSGTLTCTTKTTIADLSSASSRRPILRIREFKPTQATKPTNWNLANLHDSIKYDATFADWSLDRVRSATTNTDWGQRSSRSVAGEWALAEGVGAKANSVGSVSYGYLAGSTTGATGDYATMIGPFAGDSTGGVGANTVIAGRNSDAKGSGGVAIGYLAGTTSGTYGAQAIAIGQSAGDSASGLGAAAITIGWLSDSPTTGQISIGNGAGSSAGGGGTGALCIGYFAADGASGVGEYAVALGSGTEAAGDYSISIGRFAGDGVTADDTITIGRDSEATALNAMAFGQNSQATAIDAIAFQGATANTEEEVAWGTTTDPLYHSLYPRSAKPSNGTDEGTLYALDVGGTNVTPHAKDEAGSESSLVPHKKAVTLGAAATTFAVGSESLVELTGDAGTNTVSTITGGFAGKRLVILWKDGLITFTDTAAATADTFNMAGTLVSSANSTLHLIHDGNKWFELDRSTN